MIFLCSRISPLQHVVITVVSPTSKISWSIYKYKITDSKVMVIDNFIHEANYQSLFLGIVLYPTGYIV